MKNINLDLYLNQIIDRKENELIKVITGIRRWKTHHYSFRGGLCLQSLRKRYYIQSAFAIRDKEKMDRETTSLDRIDDFFKIIIVGDIIKP